MAWVLVYLVELLELEQGQHHGLPATHGQGEGLHDAVRLEGRNPSAGGLLVEPGGGLLLVTERVGYGGHLEQVPGWLVDSSDAYAAEADRGGAILPHIRRSPGLHAERSRGMSQKALEVVRCDRAGDLQALDPCLNQPARPFPGLKLRQYVATEENLTGEERELEWSGGGLKVGELAMSSLYRSHRHRMRRPVERERRQRMRERAEKADRIAHAKRASAASR
jgi:hypothetical protein